VTDDARGISRCSASAIPTGAVRRVQTPSERKGLLERCTSAVAAGVTIVCAAALTACSSGSVVAAATSGASPEIVAAARCMRSHGVPNYPDIGIGEINKIPGINAQSPAFKAAVRNCGGLAALSRPTPKPTAAERAAGLGYAVCMRAHGVTGFPDPVVATRGLDRAIVVGAIAFVIPPTIDQFSPAFNRAGKVCGHFLGGGPAPSGQPKGG
jgi:hypothetical protein